MLTKKVIKQNKNKSTLKVSRIATVDSNTIYSFPIVVINIIMTMATVFCLIKIAIESFGIFIDAPAGKTYIHFTPNDYKSLFIYAILGCGLICIVNGLKKHSVKATLSLLLVYLVYFLYNYKLVSNGFVHALNKAIYTIAFNKGTLPDLYYLTSFESIDPKKELVYFCWAVIFGTCFLLAFAAVKHCNPIIFTACVALYSAVPLAFNVFVGEKYFLIAAACCVVLFTQRIQGYSNSAPSGAFFGLRKRMKIGGKHVSIATFQQATAFLLCIALTLGIVSQFYDYSEYEKSESVDKFGKDLLDTVESLGSGNFSISLGNTSGGLHDGDLSRTGDLEYTGKTMFKIKGGSRIISGPLYLRGLTAANYDGKRWTQLTKRTYNDYKSMWEDFKANSFYPQFLNGHLKDAVFDDTRQYTLNIVNENINGRTFLTGTGLVPSKTNDLSLATTEYDNAFLTNGLLGLDSYEQTVILNNQEVYNAMLVQSDSNGSITDILKTGEFSYSDIVGVYAFEESELMLEQLNSFYEKELQYRNFVTENYLSYPEVTDNYIPEGFDEMVKSYFDSNKMIDSSGILYGYTDSSGIFWGYNDEGIPIEFYDESLFDESISYYYENDAYSENDFYSGLINSYENSYIVQDYYEYVISFIKEYLHANAEYTLSPGNTPKGKDFVEYFLKENHKGYCVHFATAATLMLRRAGIPARYVEGYFIGEYDMINTDDDGYVAVPDSRAHAWTEVYYPLLGWQVVDFTPSYGDKGVVPEENDSWKNKDSDTETETDTLTETDSDESDTESDTETDSDLSTDTSTDSSLVTTDSDSQSGITKSAVNIIKKIFNAIIILALVVFLWLFARLVCRKMRYNHFYSKDRRKAAKSLYTYSLWLMSIMGIVPNPGEGEEEFAKRVEKELSTTEANGFDEFTKTALKARFGRIRPSKDEVSDMREFVNKLSEVVYESSGKCKKLIIKYFLFLR